MKILWVHNFSTNEGAGIFVSQQFEYLQNEGVDVDQLRLEKIFNVLNIVKYIFMIRKMSGNYDIVHSQYGSMCSFISSFANAKRVVTLRGSDWHKLEQGSVKYRLHNYLQRLLTKLSIKKYDLIICVSKRMEGEVSKYVGINIISLPSPVDFSKFYPMDRGEAIRKLKFDENIRYILCPVFSLNNAVKRNWFIELLRKEISGQMKDVEILMASGYTHEMMNYLYNVSDAVVLASQFEGWPNVIKEALLCNVPFVTTDISDLSEFASPGNNCYVCRLDKSEFIDCIRKILATKTKPDLRSLMNGFDMAVLSSALVDLYKGLKLESRKAYRNV